MALNHRGVPFFGHRPNLIVQLLMVSSAYMIVRVWSAFLHCNVRALFGCYNHLRCMIGCFQQFVICKKFDPQSFSGEFCPQTSRFCPFYFSLVLSIIVVLVIIIIIIIIIFFYYYFLGPFQTEPLYFILFDFILRNNSFKNAKNGALFKRALDAVLRSN